MRMGYARKGERGLALLLLLSCITRAPFEIVVYISIGLVYMSIASVKQVVVILLKLEVDGRIFSLWHGSHLDDWVYLLVNLALWEKSPVWKPCIALRRHISSTNGRRR